MAQLMKIITHDALAIQRNICLELCASIMSQQLNVKVAAVIRGRFMTLFSQKSPNPKDILSIPFEKLKSIGLSGSKTTYIRNVCQFFVENKLTDKKLLALDDDEILALLVQIRGVGEWTVQMLLMFSLGREDIFAPEDLGLQQAMIKHYNIRFESKRELKQKMTAIASKWSPFQSYGCRYLWSYKDQ